MRTRLLNSRVHGTVFTVAVMSLMAPALVEGAAKAPIKDTDPSTPAPKITTPAPVRPVVLQSVGTKVFQLPNGSAINLGADLQSILNTAVTSTPAFSPSDSTSADLCDSRIEIRSAVTSFQLEVANLGVKFGYVPGGSLGPVTNLQGKLDVKIGTIAMDFSVWKCEGSKCTSVAASTATQATAGINLDMQIDFNSITTSPSFVFNTPIADALRKIMLQGMAELASSPRLTELGWRAFVKSYVPSAGVFIFDAGVQSRIGANQAFEVYAPVDTTAQGICNVYRTVAYGHTTSANAVSSMAIVDQILDSRSIHEGDIVMIHAVSSQ